QQSHRAPGPGPGVQSPAHPRRPVAAHSPAAGCHPEPDPEEDDRQSVPELLYSGHFLIKS
ncbi:MAG: hypothetical protein ACRDND_34460, partial [Streptosporangiaceae bacterium]